MTKLADINTPEYKENLEAWEQYQKLEAGGQTLVDELPKLAEEETDNDTTGKPPLSAFEGGGDGFGPVAGPEAYAPPPPPPLPPRRDEIGQFIEETEQTSSISRRRRL